MNDANFRKKQINLYYLNTKFEIIISKLCYSLINKNLKLLINLQSEKEVSELDDFLWSPKNIVIPHRTHKDIISVDEKIILFCGDYRNQKPFFDYNVIIFSPNVKVKKVDIFKNFFLFSYYKNELSVRKSKLKLENSGFMVKTLIEKQNQKWEIN
tara:strand:- start:406 stop:870 length:465 start_codon:yes stop_codon:yes gene_type:complete